MKKTKREFGLWIPTNSEDSALWMLDQIRAFLNLELPQARFREIPEPKDPKGRA